MLEQKLIVGRYIDFLNPPNAQVPNPNAPAGFTTQQRLLQHLDESQIRPAPVAHSISTNFQA
jgi:hypothetical protein